VRACVKKIGIPDNAHFNHDDWYLSEIFSLLKSLPNLEQVTLLPRGGMKDEVGLQRVLSVITAAAEKEYEIVHA
jgi:hypothetical protein